MLSTIALSLQIACAYNGVHSARSQHLRLAAGLAAPLRCSRTPAGRACSRPAGIATCRMPTCSPAAPWSRGCSACLQCWQNGCAIQNLHYYYCFKWQSNSRCCTRQAQRHAHCDMMHARRYCVASSVWTCAPSSCPPVCDRKVPTSLHCHICLLLNTCMRI